MPLPGSYGSPKPRALWWSLGGRGLFLMSEAPLQPPTVCDAHTPTPRSEYPLSDHRVDIRPNSP
eukprot:CAMPEP_0180134620 /NCGR_PEP_ID=MMETSP0986-20121125/10275_1 /TAXON_ID=697907 /ORGANISM="non described non described, Strain CCMP2293" /LENGTH=63 /DNA_ID=CAMNT_0022075025 /DNA_START=258 /DNA_END=449 /DNA_ORIENTATION=-